MDIGLILIVSILVLGGAIATAGDRIGTRVGKARLSLFKMRPRQTAVLVTILTGIAISGSTLAVLFAASKPLRTGVFQLDEIQRKLRKARGELDQTVAQKKLIESEFTKTLDQKKQTEGELAKTLDQKKQTEGELAKSKAENIDAQKRLDIINNFLQVAIAKQAQTSKQARTLVSQISSLRTERQDLIKQRDRVKGEIVQLQVENNRRKAENNQLKVQNNQLQNRVTERDLEIAQQEQVIAEGQTLLKERDKQLEEAIAQRQSNLKDLEKQLAYLQQELARQEKYAQYYQALRQGNVAVLRGQVLAFRVVRITNPSASRQAIDQLLSEAQRNILEATRSNNSNRDERVVQISPAQADQLIEQIKDGRDYVVRILSAGNYVVGEKQVQVFADAVLNQVVFPSGEVIATTSADPLKMSEDELRQRLEQLVTASQFRARRAGVLGDTIQVGDDRLITLINFIEQLKQYNQPVDLKAVISEDTYTAGPLKMNLVAIRNGQIVFST